MDDNFDYREINSELDDIDELVHEILEEQQCSSWELAFKNSKFAVFVNFEGQLRVISSLYIDSLFTKS